MVVECRKCGTRFKLDASRLPDAGIRVRCSRCKHAFFLQNPAAGEQHAIEAIATETAANPSHAGPEMTQDLPLQQDPGPTEAPAAAASSQEAGDFDDFDEEDDWQFNEDPPIEEEEAPVAAPVLPTPSLADPSMADGDHDGFELGEIDDDLCIDPDALDLDSETRDTSVTPNSQSGLALELDGTRGSRAGIEGAESNPTVEKGSGPISLPVAAPEPAADEMDFSDLVDLSKPAPGFGGERADAFGTVDDFSSLMEPDEQEATAAPATDDGDLEDPSSWDFFSDDDLKSVSPPMRAAQPDLTASATAGDFEELLGNRDAGDSEAVGARGLAPEEEQPIGVLVRVGVGAGWFLTFCLLSIGLWRGIVFPINNGVRPPTYVEVGPMRATEIKGRWLDTAQTGLVYAISGELVNPGSAAAVPGVALRIALLDSDGHLLPNASVAVGTGVSVNDVREMTPAQWTSALAEAGRQLPHRPIAAGESVAFLAMIDVLPVEAAHFQLITDEPELTPNREVTTRGFPQ